MKKFRVKVDGDIFEVEVQEIAGAEHQAKPSPAPAPGVKVAPAQAPAPVKSVAVAPTQASKAPSAGTPAATGDGQPVTAPLPGSILTVKVDLGQEVSSGDVVVVIEAMKMENEIVAPVNGTVKQILVSKGQTVATGDVLAVIG